MNKKRFLRVPGRKEILERLRSWMPFAPGLLLVWLGVTVLLYPEAFRAAVGIFFVLTGLVAVHVVRKIRRILGGLQARIEVYSEEESEEEPSSLPVLSDAMRQWVN